MWGAILGAPTLRLRGDYLAIVTLAFGEIVPRVFESRRATSARNLDISNGRQGITPVDKPWCADPGPRQHHPRRHHALLLHRARDAAGGAVRQHPPARLAPRPRVDRGPRGRGRRRCDGRPPRAREALGVRDRRVDRRLRGRVPRRLPEHDQRRPVRVRLLGLHPLHDHPRRHGQHRRRDPRRGRAVDDQPLPAAPARHASRRSSGSTSTSPRSRSASSASCCW